MKGKKSILNCHLHFQKTNYFKKKKSKIIFLFHLIFFLIEEKIKIPTSLLYKNVYTFVLIMVIYKSTNQDSIVIWRKVWKIFSHALHKTNWISFKIFREIFGKIKKKFKDLNYDLKGCSLFEDFYLIVQNLSLNFDETMPKDSSIQYKKRNETKIPQNPTTKSPSDISPKGQQRTDLLSNMIYL